MESKLSPELVTKLGQKSLGLYDVNQQLGFLNKEFQILVGDDFPKNPNCEKIQVLFIKLYLFIFMIIVIYLFIYLVRMV